MKIRGWIVRLTTTVRRHFKIGVSIEGLEDSDWQVMSADWKTGGSDFRIVAGKSTGKRSLGRPRLRWEDNIMDLKEIGVNMRNWVASTEDGNY